MATPTGQLFSAVWCLERHLTDPVVPRQLRYALEVAGVVGDYGCAQAKGVGGNHQVIAADQLALDFQGMPNMGIVHSGFIVPIERFDVLTQQRYSGPVFFHTVGSLHAVQKLSPCDYRHRQVVWADALQALDQTG